MGARDTRSLGCSRRVEVRMNERKTLLQELRIGDRVCWSNDTKTESIEGVVVSDTVDPDGAYPIVWATDTDHVGGCLPEECSLVGRAVYLDAEDQARIKNAMTLLDERGLWMASGHLREILKKAT